MAGLKLLLDTNIVIELEDPRPLSADTAALSQRAQLYGLTLYTHEASLRDVERDRNVERRTLTLSKLKRYPMLEEVAHDEFGLIAIFGPIKDDNDRCDVLMLDALRLGIVDFLVSEDIGLHRRAARCGLGDRTFRIVDALAWLRRTFEPREVHLPYVLAKKAHQIPINDPIFDSLRQDYTGFDDWFKNKCRPYHRDCWIIELDGRLAGLLIRKDEQGDEAPTSHPGSRVLKICTFKISPEFRGEKLGEHLLKKVLWFAQANRYDLIYLTAFPKQEFLINLLQQFGFEATRTLSNGELVLERTVHHEPAIEVGDDINPLEVDLSVFPRFYDGARVRKFAVPIRPKYHIVLFPEIAEAPAPPLFPDERLVIGGESTSDRTPGNTIRKVYVCRAATRQLTAGDILLFYLSKSDQLTRSQCITSVGVVEKTQLASSVTDLMRCVGRRSVYSQRDLIVMNPQLKSPVLVIDFLLIGHLDPAVSIGALIAKAILTSPPQSIGKIEEHAFEKLRAMMSFSFS
jgi:ribosomal protein S18 acetylase RimI-like enzyme